MPLTTQPFAQLKELETLRRELDVNVAQPERVGSVLGGAFLAVLGLKQGGLGGALLALVGGMFVYRGATGHCYLYEEIGVDTARPRRSRGVPGNKGIRVERTIRIERTASDLYNYWRQLENLPRFMAHLKSVRQFGRNRSHWIVKGPAGTSVEWDAEIINERPGKMLAWQSLPGAEVENAGSVWFEPVSGGFFTEVKVALQYQPPAGVVGAAVAKIFGESPEQQLEADLARFKNLVEHGAVANAE